MRRRLAALGAALLPAGQAFAAAPYTTDDAGVLAPGEVQVTPYGDAVFRPGSDNGEFGIDATVGLANGVEFGAAVPFASFDAAADRFALGDLTLHTKIALSERGMQSPGIAIAPILTIPTNRGGRAKVGLDLPLIASFDGADWALHVSAGYRLQARIDGGSLPFGGVVYEHGLSERVWLGGELYAEGAGAGKALLMAGPGITWAVSSRVELTAECNAILINQPENGRFHAFVALVVSP